MGRYTHLLGVFTALTRPWKLIFAGVAVDDVDAIASRLNTKSLGQRFL